MDFPDRGTRWARALCVRTRFVTCVKEKLAGNPYGMPAKIGLVKLVPSGGTKVWADLCRNAIARIFIRSSAESDMDIVILFPSSLTVDALTPARIGVMGVDDESHVLHQTAFTKLDTCACCVQVPQN